MEENKMKYLEENIIEIDLNDIKGECHIFFTGDKMSCCGKVPSDEVPCRGIRPWQPYGVYGKMKKCPVCNLDLCEKCKAA
jgi:hypothetical protein